MNPKKSQIQQLLPYALPVSLVIGISILVLTGGGRHEEGSVRVESKAAETSAASPRIRNSALPDTIGIPASQILRDQAPADARVADLIKSYQAGTQSVAVADIEALAARPQGKRVSFSVAGMDLSGVIQSRKEDGAAVSLSILLDDELGRFTLSLRPGQRAYSTLFFEGEQHAFLFHGYPENGQWQVAHKSVGTLRCAPVDATFSLQNMAAGMPRAAADARNTAPRRGPVGAPPELESDPTSTYVIYIDLDGEVVDQPEWSDAPIDAEPHPRADDVGFVTRVWERVSEDFVPFDINVTTSRAVFDAAAPDRRMMCVATPTDTAMPGSGGVAYLTSFGSGLVCWAFNQSEHALAETVSHEVGHTLGLSHDGEASEYYGGHGTGDVSWGPIMGASFNPSVTQWCKGEYTNATNQEDDLVIITRDNGFGYRLDDYGNTKSEATAMLIDDGAVDQSGVIERNTDEDWLSFSTSGGSVTITADVTNIDSPDEDTHGANLALSLTLYDSKDKEVAMANPEDTCGASISLTLPSGTYYMKIKGEGRKDADTGFTNYASMGRYFLSGVVPQNGLLRVDPPEANIAREGGTSSFKVFSSEAWTWSCNSAWVTSDSPTSQSGNGQVTYRVARNESSKPRTARIKLRSGEFETYHLVRQAGASSDDHGNTFDEATLVGQVSTTTGVLEEALDVDMFRIDVEGFGDLTVKTTGYTDTYGEFYDAKGVRMASDDNGARPNCTMTRRVASGTYYVGIRHSVEGGIGKYSLNCSFDKQPALIINPPNRKVSSSGGRFLINVVSNTDWTWTTDVSWIQSSSDGTESKGQMLPYVVDSYNGGVVRKGRIIFRNNGNRVVHIVTQLPANDDDHTDQRSTASELSANGKAKGIIQFEGDADMFRLEFATSGALDLMSTGNSDTVGELLDKKGNSILTVDDGNGDNFHIQKALGAGTYFLRVTAFGGAQVGSYALQSAFTPSRLVDVSYSAGPGGVVRGDIEQAVPLGGFANSVTAVPSRGYSFVRWSDGVRNPRRSDGNLITHLKVTAKFAGTVEVSTHRGMLTSKQMPPVDFGSVSKGKSHAIKFTIRNQGSTPLTNLRIQPDGVTSKNWRVSKPSRGTIPRGKKATFRIILSGDEAGYNSAQWAIRAQGMKSNFIVRTTGVVGSNGSAGALAETQSTKSSPVAGSKPASAALSLPWIEVSPDGYFRYRFGRPADDSTEQVFWISSDGVSWEEALVLDVWKTESAPRANFFEAILAPPGIPSHRILVNETAP